MCGALWQTMYVLREERNHNIQLGLDDYHQKSASYGMTATFSTPLHVHYDHNAVRYDTAYSSIYIYIHKKP